MAQEKKITIIREGVERQITKTALGLLGEDMEGHEIKKTEAPKNAKHEPKTEPAKTEKTPEQIKAEKDAKDAEANELKKKQDADKKSKYDALVQEAKESTDDEKKYSLLTEAHELLPNAYTEKQIAKLKEKLKLK